MYFMNRLNKIKLTTLLLILISIGASAQSTEQVEMADSLRANGKIYIVVIVLAVIFIGIVAFLFNTDRKVSRLEKEIRERKN
jgi:CcmD family protein